MKNRRDYQLGDIFYQKPDLIYMFTRNEIMWMEIYLTEICGNHFKDFKIVMWYRGTKLGKHYNCLEVGIQLVFLYRLLYHTKWVKILTELFWLNVAHQSYTFHFVSINCALCEANIVIFNLFSLTDGSPINCWRNLSINLTMTSKQSFGSRRLYRRILQIILTVVAAVHYKCSDSCIANFVFCISFCLYR